MSVHERRLLGKHYATGERISLTIADGRIQSVTATDDVADPVPWIGPALFDLQINGAIGISFADAQITTADIERVVRVCSSHGIGGLLPTLVTGSFTATEAALRAIRRATLEVAALAQAIPGVHLEGPWISPHDGPRGAHPLAHVRRADRDEFLRWQESAEGMIRLVTLAPEQADTAFIEWLCGQGVVVALGHTAATGMQIREAISAGATLSTHLGNGCHANLPRHENPIWEQLAADDLHASLISDGHHLPPAVLKSLVRGKSPERVIITCDASSLAGMSPGRYQAWGAEVEVQANGRVSLAGTPFLAGSGVFTDDCVSGMTRMAGVSWDMAWEMASIHPRRLLGLPICRLEPGDSTDLALFDVTRTGQFVIHEVISSA